MSFGEETEVIHDNYNTDIIKTFIRMFIGLLVTCATSYFTFKSGLFLQVPYGILAIVELIVVLVFSFAFKKLPPIAVSILYYAYAVLNGVTLSTIFLYFTLFINDVINLVISVINLVISVINKKA